MLTSPETYRIEPEQAWQRLKTRARRPKELAVLMEVAAWREREAQARDVPRGRVLKDEVIGDIAVQAPTTLEKLARPALAAQGLRALEMGDRHPRRGEARARARPEVAAAASTATSGAERHRDAWNCSRCCCA